MQDDDSMDYNQSKECGFAMQEQVLVQRNIKYVNLSMDDIINGLK
jgi:hypothetical protein